MKLTDMIANGEKILRLNTGNPANLALQHRMKSFVI